MILLEIQIYYHLKDDKIGYKYINFIVRGNEPIHCSMELCEKRPIDK